MKQVCAKSGIAPSAVSMGALLCSRFREGAGYGPANERDPALVRRDLAGGYISAETAKRDYGFSDADIDEVMKAVERGETV